MLSACLGTHGLETTALSAGCCRAVPVALLGGSGHLSPSSWPLQPQALTPGWAVASGLALWWS